MTRHSTRPADETALFLGDGWSDPLEAGLRDRIRGFIGELIEEELAAALGRGRYARRRCDGRRGERCRAAFRSPARPSRAPARRRLLWSRRDHRPAGAGNR